MSVPDKPVRCPVCTLPVTDVNAHICIQRISRRSPPRLEIVEESEINAEVDGALRGIDGVFRPVFVGQDDGACLALTLEDAKRLYDFLDSAIIYLSDTSWEQ